ncbi:Coenzyme F420 hydrogenase/dehydrogenase, beta subunit C-terminal domain [Arthrobacter sp. GMC3]|uniref:Coenzyme F420 hydrogenase/dehydrogenase, beta subunit C-terminal domain n=1 Tax=Arthrobacter sp. GMC3 TaxID=2058894 RepID=UPI000CE55362|nr:Coenzyme F420 hydrogenase/dehydrogenase, beta subunit C-terminal domain [Arthrobacter sp. GMC3]
MELDARGFMRPVRKGFQASTGGTGVPAGALESFDLACPGVRVRAQHPAGSRRHEQLGPIVQAWEAWATDPVIRQMGSSGGTLTALSMWLLQTGQASQVIGAQADPENARRSITVQIISKEQALAASGSRYAPASNAADPEALELDTAFVGKPCEASAIRALSERKYGPNNGPVLLSFFCAGTPSQHATDRLVSELVPGEDAEIVDLRYRGNGWPGDFSITCSDGTTKAMSYDDSWGSYLGPTTQWRCKICPDGVGESADITAGDFWRADENGYPLFSDQAGISALLARTERGRDLVLAAAAAGVLTLAEMDVQALVKVQPLQRRRRETLFARLAGTVAAGGKVPKFAGFCLLRLALPRPRESLRAAKATYQRRKKLES